MPSIIPSYVYTLMASIVVGTLLIYAFDVSTIGTKNQAEEQQLTNIAEYVATKSCELVSATMAENLSASLRLELQPLIGDQRYWIQLGNDSLAGWIESGYGPTLSSTEHHVPIPFEVCAVGTYVSDSGTARLSCWTNSTGTYLQLSGGS